MKTNQGRRKERTISLPNDWWQNLLVYCSAHFDTRIADDIYDLTQISRKTFSKARDENCFTEKLFALLAANLACETSAELLNILKSPTSAKTVARIYGNVPNFLPSEFGDITNILQKLMEHFQESDQPSRAIITGSTGQGKTRLAREFAIGAKERGLYKTICWIGSENVLLGHDDIEFEIRSIAGRLGVQGEINDTRFTDVVQKLTRRLKPQAPCLFIFDNLDSADIFNEIRDLLDVSHVIITTKLNITIPWLRFDIDLPLTKAQTESGARFILERTGKNESVIDDAIRLGKMLDWNMRKLEKAIIYINDNQVCISEFLELRRKQDEKVFHDPDTLMVFDAIRKESPLAFKLFCLAGCFAPDAVPVEFIRGKRESLPEFNSLTTEAFETKCLKPLLKWKQLVAVEAQSGAEDGGGLHRIHRADRDLLWKKYGSTDLDKLLPVAIQMLESVWGQSKTCTGSGVTGLDVLSKSPWLLTNSATVVNRFLELGGGKEHIDPRGAAELVARLSSTYEHNFQFERAEKLMSTAIPWFEQKSKNLEQATENRWKEGLAKLHHNKGGLYTAWACEEAVKKAEKKEVDSHNWTALTAHLASLKCRQDAFGAENLETLTYKQCVACAYRNIPDLLECRQHIQPVIRIREQFVKDSLRKTGHSLTELSNGRFKNLDADIKKHVCLLAFEYGILGCAERDEKKYGRARDLFEKELVILEALAEEGFPIASASARLAEILNQSKKESDKARAKQLLENARRILTEHPNARFVRYNCRWDVQEFRNTYHARCPDKLEKFVTEASQCE